MPEARPIEHAVLRVEDPAVLWRRAGGLSVLERQLFTAARAGLKAVRVARTAPEPARLARLRLPAGLDVSWAPGGEGALLELRAERFVRTEALARIVRGDARELPAGGPETIRADDPGVGDWLMASGPKSQDGFMARHFDRRISGALSRRLLDTPVTPNMMTVASTLLGLAGAALFLGGSRPAAVAGALLVWLHSTLDGCDGELARVRFQESAFGADLDFWGDNLVHLALFACMGAGLWRAGGGPQVLVLGAAAAGGALASAWTAWKHRLERRRARAAEAGVVEEIAGDGVESRLARLENALAQRDFIYLLVPLAALDLLHGFLWAAAVGGALYFAIMLYLRRINHGHPQQPHPAR